MIKSFAELAIDAAAEKEGNAIKRARAFRSAFEITRRSNKPLPEWFAETVEYKEDESDKKLAAEHSLFEEQQRTGFVECRYCGKALRDLPDVDICSQCIDFRHWVAQHTPRG